MLQATAHSTGLNPDHRIDCRIGTWVTVKDINRDGKGLDPAGVPGKSFLHDELQKALLPVGVDKISASDDALERVMNELGRNRLVGIV
jgi:hypothetical protein